MPLLVLEERAEGLGAREAETKDYVEVLEALLLLLEPGEVTTYGEIARLLGISPRTVGRLLASNRRVIVVPCHRVVAKEGLGGYSSGGPEVKARLLELESDGKPRIRHLALELIGNDTKSESVPHEASIG